MPFTEPLFVALAAWSLVALLGGRWITAGVLCLLAGATRPFGGALAVAVALAAAVAIVLAIANLALMAAGWKINGHENPVAGGLIFAALMGSAGIGMLRMRYYAVLGFEALLGIAIVAFALFLVRASNVLAVVLCLAVIGFGGWLFWKLVRVMSRMQAPAR
jgi:hypothetical protein